MARRSGEAAVSAPILIAGQGLAGTLLGFALEEAGLDFRIVDAGHAGAASRAAAGIINPVAGRRFVKAPQIDLLLPLARATYARLEQILGVPLWREMRVRRWFRDDRERRIFSTRHAAGELAPYVSAVDADGCWIGPAARVDVPALLTAGRQRWVQAGFLSEGKMDWAAAERHPGVVIDCTGASARTGLFRHLDLVWSKGETLLVGARVAGDDVILNRGHWFVPTAADAGWVGATHVPGVDDLEPTADARDELMAAAGALTGGAVSLREQRVGVRLAHADKMPVAGWHPANPRVGIYGGLGGRGVLWAPWLARQWVGALTGRGRFDPAVAVDRPVGLGSR